MTQKKTLRIKCSSCMIRIISWEKLMKIWRREFSKWRWTWWMIGILRSRLSLKSFRKDWRWLIMRTEVWNQILLIWKILFKLLMKVPIKLREILKRKKNKLVLWWCHWKVTKRRWIRNWHNCRRKLRIWRRKIKKRKMRMKIWRKN